MSLVGTNKVRLVALVPIWRSARWASWPATAQGDNRGRKGEAFSIRDVSMLEKPAVAQAALSYPAAVIPEPLTFVNRGLGRLVTLTADEVNRRRVSALD
jgi:hypothetical protein